jgi:hypothetical protein
LLPLTGILPTDFANIGVVVSFSTDFNRLALVGDRARSVFAEDPANLLGVPRTEELRFGKLGFVLTVRGVTVGGGGIKSPSFELGLEPLPIAEGGLDRCCIGLSGEKKLDFLLTLAGEGGILARLSIVRSDSEGREFLRNVGVSGVVVGEVALVE